MARPKRSFAPKPVNSYREVQTPPVNVNTLTAPVALVALLPVITPPLGDPTTKVFPSLLMSIVKPEEVSKRQNAISKRGES
jgi:hypothetical protein